MRRTKKVNDSEINENNVFKVAYLKPQETIQLQCPFQLRPCITTNCMGWDELNKLCKCC